MKRVSVLLSVVAIACGVFLFITDRNTDITVLDARATPMAGSNDRFMVTFDVQNAGDAATLTGVRSDSANMVHVMNTGHEGAPIVIPANSVGFFAMDGAHVMMMGTNADYVEGTFLPLTLEFAQGPDVTTRVLHIGTDDDMAGMDHSQSNGVEVDPSPVITLSAEGAITAAGGKLSVSITNFTFARVADDAPHVPNEGHGHIYLNGLKLGRLYSTEFSLGALASGGYELVVALNSNAHQPYVNAGELIQAALSFSVP